MKISDVNKKSLYFPRWYQAGIICISDFPRIKEPFSAFNLILFAKLNFLQHYSILSSVPSFWKKKCNSTEARKAVLAVASTCDPLTSEGTVLYERLLSPDELPPHSVNSYNTAKKRTPLVYFVPQIIHRILPTNSLSHKMQI